MKSFFHAFFMCQSMFCAIPCPCKIWDEDARDKLLWCLPLVGLEIGLLWWCLGLLCRFLGLSQAVTGIALCAMPFFATGFIHLDGFMDVTDAVGSCRDLAKRREILKDSHVGSFAVIGVVLLILCQFAFCVSLTRKRSFVFCRLRWSAAAAAALAVALLPKMSTSQYVRKQAKAADIWIPCAFLAGAIAFAFSLRFRCGLVLLVQAAGYGLALRKAYRSLEGMNGDISGYALTLSELSALGRWRFCKEASMKLIIGGAYQGKRAFAMEKLGIPETQIFTCEDTHIDFSNALH